MIPLCRMLWQKRRRHGWISEEVRICYIVSFVCSAEHCRTLVRLAFGALVVTKPSHIWIIQNLFTFLIQFMLTDLIGYTVFILKVTAFCVCYSVYSTITDGRLLLYFLPADNRMPWYGIGLGATVGILLIVLDEAVASRQPLFAVSYHMYLIY